MHYVRLLESIRPFWKSWVFVCPKHEHESNKLNHSIYNDIICFRILVIVVADQKNKKQIRTTTTTMKKKANRVNHWPLYLIPTTPQHHTSHHHITKTNRTYTPWPKNSCNHRIKVSLPSAKITRQMPHSAISLVCTSNNCTRRCDHIYKHTDTRTHVLHVHKCLVSRQTGFFYDDLTHHNEWTLYGSRVE